MIEFENVFPLPLEGVEAEQGQTAAAPLLFRGLSIAWVAVAKTKTVLVSECAFDGDDDTRDVENRNHLIAYKGNTKTRRDFMKSEFDEYRMHPYKVKFLTDDVFRLGGNQRSKLQYHILAQRFPLVHVSE